VNATIDAEMIAAEPVTTDASAAITIETTGVVMTAETTTASLTDATTIEGAMIAETTGAGTTDTQTDAMTTAAVTIATANVNPASRATRNPLRRRLLQQASA
jgi:hypothetical protein